MASGIQTSADLPVEGKTVKALTLLSLKRTLDLFVENHGLPLPMDEESQRIKIACKVRDEYSAVQHLVAPGPSLRPAEGPALQNGALATNRPAQDTPSEPSASTRVESRSATAKLIDTIAATPSTAGATSANALTVYNAGRSTALAVAEVLKDKGQGSAAISRRLAANWPRPVWHPPWKLYRTIAGHLGWVRSIAVDVSNEWFVTGSADRTIKFWDLASGQLKLTLTGHTEQVTGLGVSDRSPYLFSCALDKQVKCWDLEQNKAIRNYHGHLSGVYSLALHPTLDVLMTGGRDSVCRVWDMRSKVQAMVLAGHDNTVASILTQPTDPQVITGSHDSTIRCWDLRKGSTIVSLTHHKKSVRALVAHPKENAFASASADNLKKWALPGGDFLHNMLTAPRSITNALALNEDGVMVSGSNSGGMMFWDWKSGHCFQQEQTLVQPGSLDSEACIYGLSFDRSGSRLITCEADKTIKMWKQDEHATPQTCPGLPFHPPKDIKRF